MLPPGHEPWAGGHGIKPIRKDIDGVYLAAEFQNLFDCLAR
jgi:hypothetical protein